ncbi:DUF2975 domain-containing protein [Nonomuraea sp. LPB2021202275-12-8]|uniref:DUF2975 domain-containing protein n=1 Tax=Nonomuraea sp. LPB2021202275-12-8 TaxID=3120159 RepID=UPI00300CCB6F
MTKPPLSIRLLAVTVWGGLGLALPDLLLVLILGIVAVLLLVVIRTFGAGDPFVPANARRLVTIGFLLIGVGMLPRVEDLALWALLSGTPLEGVTMGAVQDHHWAVVSGFVVLALAEVFRQGSRLRADTAGLV